MRGHTFERVSSAAARAWPVVFVGRRPSDITFEIGRVKSRILHCDYSISTNYSLKSLPCSQIDQNKGGILNYWSKLGKISRLRRYENKIGILNYN